MKALDFVATPVGERVQAARGQSYFTVADEDEDPIVQFTIVGTVPDQNFKDLHNKVKPMAFLLSPEPSRVASIRVRGDNLTQTLADVDAVWEQVNPDYPIQRRFLDEIFADVYAMFKAMNGVLTGFAAMALSLALIGLAAFMAQRRTREIGIRKVLGARVGQIVRLLVWRDTR